MAINQYVEFLDRDLSEIAPYDVIVVGNDMSDVEAARLSGVPVVAVGHEPELDDGIVLLSFTNSKTWMLLPFCKLTGPVHTPVILRIKIFQTIQRNW